MFDSSNLVNFIEGNEVLDNLEETVSEIEFDEE